MNADFLDLIIYFTAAVLIALICCAARTVWRQRIDMDIKSETKGMK